VLIAFFMLSPQVKAQEVNHWETILAPGRMCRYLVPTSPVDASWTAPGFDDSGWIYATGGVGYGDGDDNTTITQALSVYCRYEFVITSPEVLGALILDMDFDDGFVAYLNGTELARNNMGEPGSSTSYNQLADGLHEASVYRGWEPNRYILEEGVLDLLVAGTNTLALEVHNESITSSDLSSNPYLHGGIIVFGNHFSPTPSWFYPPFTEDSTLLPLIVIDTDGEQIPDEPRITAQMKLINNGVGNYNATDDPGNGYEGQISIELRGESSLGLFPKKSYSLETQTDSGTNNNVSLLGLPSENDWVLYAPYADKSLIRNVLSYRVFEEMGHYSPRTRFVEVVVNGDYKGIFILTEKIKRDKNRVDMAKLLPVDIAGDELTGGYLLRIDKTSRMADYEYWKSPVQPLYPDYEPVVYQYFDPDYSELNQTQRDYIRNHLLEFETSLISGNFKDPSQGYRSYLDMPSFMDLTILNEFTKDVDGFRLSHYFYKQKDSDGGKLVTGPPWDYNLTFGNVNFLEDVREPTNWVHTIPITIHWWPRIMEDYWFRRELRCRWDELYATVLSSDHLHGIIDSTIQVMGASIPKNYERWPVLGTYVWPNSYVGSTYSDEEWFLRNWIDDRLEWMNSKWGGVCWPTSDESGQTIPPAALARVYPNPSDLSHAYVDLNGFMGSELSIRVFDMAGRVVFQSLTDYAPGEFAYALPDLSFLSGGIYTLEVTGRDTGERVLCKMIRE
jgi:hypothetical protein